MNSATFLNGFVGGMASAATVGGRFFKRAGVVTAVAGLRFPPVAALGAAFVGGGTLVEAAGTTVISLCEGESLGRSLKNGFDSVFDFKSDTERFADSKKIK
jgi:hypothetical protein